VGDKERDDRERRERDPPFVVPGIELGRGLGEKGRERGRIKRER